MMHLNCRTSYSFQRGYGDLEDWRKRSQEIGIPFAIADYCSTFGHPTFAGHALLGVQLPMVGVLDKSPQHGLASVYATDELGLAALYELVTLANKQHYYRPRVTFQQAWEHMEGHGFLVLDAANMEMLNEWSKVGFGALAVTTEPTLLSKAAGEFASIVAQGAQYPGPEHRELHRVASATGAGHRQGEYGVDGSHMLSRTDLDRVLRSTHHDLNLDALWDRTEQVTYGLEPIKIPQAPLIQPHGLPSLDEMIKEGIKDRFFTGQMPVEYEERLALELEVIRDKSFEDYFRFVADVVGWAKRRFLVGPGRGSSGGSLVCYILGITDVDPIQHDLLFARFIDPGRPDLPDIDVDFPDIRRDEVFNYLRKKYGADHVAKLGTISRWKPLSAINDVARVHRVSRDDLRPLRDAADGIAVPVRNVLDWDGPRMVLSKHPEMALIADLENKPRHSGVHPAGIVLSERPITNFGSVSNAGVLSVDLDGAESVGLLKFDALGLRTLTVIERAMALAGLEPSDYHNILSECTDATGDAEVYENIFQQDRLTGIFQFEGHAVRELAKRIKVDCFSDLCALTSLARPGPLNTGQAAKWCSLRMGEIEPDYGQLYDLAPETFGMLVYQEQTMKVVRELAGFDEIEVNKFRKAMGKKIPEAMAAMREAFVAGYVHVNWPKEPDVGTAEDIFDMLDEYSGYAFNKSHAVAYSKLTYLTAWLKHHYPLQFVCAQLTSMDDDQKTKALLRDLVAEGHEYVPFDLEKSDINWSIVDGKVYGGFTAVRGIGKKTAEACVKMRAADPVNWTKQLTPAQRNKILSPYNTPWHDLTRMGEVYGAAYKDPKRIKVHERLWMIDDIPEEKGKYVFLGKLVRAVEREKTENDKFINLFFEDDSGECGCTINRFKAAGYRYLLEPDALDKDYLVRADIISDGRKWFFLSKIREISAGDISST